MAMVLDGQWRGKGHFQGIKGLSPGHIPYGQASHRHTGRQRTVAQAITALLPRKEERGNSDHDDKPDKISSLPLQGSPSIRSDSGL